MTRAHWSGNERTIATGLAVLLVAAAVLSTHAVTRAHAAGPREPGGANAAQRAVAMGASQGHLPVRFEQNHGQAPADVKVLSPGSGYRLSLTQRELVIDPVLSYSTYFGATGDQVANGVATDAARNLYVVGTTSGTPSHAFVSKFDPTGSTRFVTKMNSAGTALLYSTYLAGSVADGCTAIAVDPAGKIYVTGSTESADFPTAPGAFDRMCGTDGECNPYVVCGGCEIRHNEDSFVVKIDPALSGAASLVYGTFLGGENRDLGSPPR